MTAPHRVYPDLLSPDEQAALFAFALANQAGFTDSRVRAGVVEPTLRRSRSLRNLGPSARVLRQKVRDMYPTMLRDLGASGFQLSSIELEMVAHGDGDHFSRHIDTMTGEARSERGDRVLSGVYYFHREPRGFNGGELRLHGFGPEGVFIDVDPRPNMLVVFPSWAPHEVMPIVKPSADFADSRFAVNCWLYRDGLADDAPPQASGLKG